MKVFLVQAYLGGTEVPVFPMGLSALAAFLNEHEVRVFDPNVESDYPGSFARALDEFKPDVIGISLRNIDSTNKRKVVFYYDYLKAMIDVIKASGSSATPLVVGGSGFSMFAERIMEDETRIDFGVYLEGEQTFAELLEHMDEPMSVRGIYYRDGAQIRFSGARMPAAMEELPAPCRSYAQPQRYTQFPESIGVETKRGCPLKCAYCTYGFLNGTRYRFRRPEAVVDEIEELVTRHGVSVFTFVDSTFNVPLEQATAICGELVQRNLGVTWSAWFHDAYMPLEFLELIRDAGCRKVILSPDGYCPSALQGLGKSQTHEDIIATYERLKTIPEFEVCYNFFKNPPGQTLAGFIGLVWFFIRAKLALRGRIHFEFSSLRVEPNTRLRDIALEEGQLSAEDDLLYPQGYSQKSTRYIEWIFDLLLKLKGM